MNINTFNEADNQTITNFNNQRMEIVQNVANPNQDDRELHNLRIVQNVANPIIFPSLDDFTSFPGVKSVFPGLNPLVELDSNIKTIRQLEGEIE